MSVGSAGNEHQLTCKMSEATINKVAAIVGS
jgi:hypothetical protein